jgi:hypothetical protein
VTLVLSAIVVTFLAILQIGIAGMAHTMLAGAAADAARGVAISRDLEVGQARVDRIAQLPFLTVEDVSIRERWLDGLLMIEVSLSAHIPALIPWGGRSVQITRHSLVEQT